MLSVTKFGLIGTRTTKGGEDILFAKLVREHLFGLIRKKWKM
jgi:hypothetical protein